MDKANFHSVLSEADGHNESSVKCKLQVHLRPEEQGETR